MKLLLLLSAYSILHFNMVCSLLLGNDQISFQFTKVGLWMTPVISVVRVIAKILEKIVSV